MATPPNLYNPRARYQDLLSGLGVLNNPLADSGTNYATAFSSPNTSTGYSNAQMSQILASIGQLANTVVSQDIKNVEGSSAISGAFQGAATGAGIGGVPGAAIGAGIGLVTGFLTGSSQRRAYERALRRAQEDRARKIIGGIRNYREGLLAQSSKFKRALASGHFTQQHTQLIGDVAARFGYLSALGEGITSETGKALKKAYHAKATNMIDGAQVAIEEKVANLLYVQQKLREEERKVDEKKYSNYRPDLTKYNALLRSGYA